jgi:hypothetical protein
VPDAQNVWRTDPLSLEFTPQTFEFIRLIFEFIRLIFVQIRLIFAGERLTFAQIRLTFVEESAFLPNNHSKRSGGAGSGVAKTLPDSPP